MFHKLDKLMDAYLEAGIPSIDISVMQGGREIYRRMGGFSDAARTVPVNGRERYNIYSCTKPITCTAALMLLERGALRLEDKLAKYIPAFGEMTVRGAAFPRPAIGEIRIVDLFTMSAGFNYDLDSPSLRLARAETDGLCPTVETVKYLAREPLSFDPGTRYQYSLCHDVLAALVEVVSGTEFSLFVKQNIFDRLGMTESTLLPSEQELASLAAQYCYNERTGGFDVIGPACIYRLGSRYASGGAGCVTSVNDYMKFLEGLRRGDLLSPETVRLMCENRLPAATTREEYDMLPLGYGYGLGVRCPYGPAPAPDFGWGGAAGAYLGILPAYNAVFFYAQHVLSGGPNADTRRLLPRYVAEALS